MRLSDKKLLKLLRDHAPDAVPFRDIMSHFGIPKGERKTLLSFVQQQVEAGRVIALSGNRFQLAAEEGLITGTLSRHRDGYGFVTPDGGGDDLFIPPKGLEGNLHGDIVEVRLVKSRYDGKKEGRIVRTVTRGVQRVVGRYRLLHGTGMVIPDDQRVGPPVSISSRDTGGASDGMVVVAELTAYPSPGKSPEGRVVEVLGRPDDPDVEVMTAVHSFGLPHEFTPQAMAEAAAVPLTVPAGDVGGREDLRGRVFVTIDGETARDFDDAVSVAKEGRGKIRLWVAIADVGHYVKPGSAIDGEAYERGTSVYFPDRCIPMLPEALSNGICSLNPGVDRLTMTAEMLFDTAGTMTAARFYPAVIRSRNRLTYTEVKQVLVDKDTEERARYADILADLALMEELALRLMKKRHGRGSIDFDLPEPEIILDLQGQTEAIVRSERNLAHRIIEEFMLAANEAVATHIEGAESPSLYRVHENPDPAKLSDFREFIFNFGYRFAMEEDRVDPAELQRILAEAEGKPEERMIYEVLLRCMKHARYAAENLGHFGLAARTYTHFTSPIRRYPDLVVHRILKKLIAGKLSPQERERLARTLPDTAVHTSKRERVAMEAEREVVALKKVQFMRDKVGEEFDAYITGVSHHGFFVELVELFVEGMVPITTLGNDWYRYEEKQHLLRGERTKGQYRIGDRVRVRLSAVSLERKQLEFAVAGMPQRRSADDRFGVEEGEYVRTPVRGKRPPRRNDAGGGGGGRPAGRGKGGGGPRKRR